MTKNTAYLFKKLKGLIRVSIPTQEDRVEIARTLRYVERSCLLTNIQAQNLVVASGRIVRLIKKHETQLPEEFLKGFTRIWSSLKENQEVIQENQEMIKHDSEKNARMKS